MSVRWSITRCTLPVFVILAACVDGGPTAPASEPLSPGPAVRAGGAMPTATITDLGSYQSAPYLQVAAINNAGQVVGAAQFLVGGNSYVQIPWTWTEADGMTPMDVPAGLTGVLPTDINDAGAIVGYGRPGYVPVYWPNASAPGQLLPLLPGHSTGGANALNEAGVIVGYSAGTSSLDRHAVRWITPSTVEEFEPSLTGGGAWAINEAGHIAGYVIPYPADGFFWADGVLTNFGTLGGGWLAYTSDMNDHDVVVGRTYDTDYRGFIWDAATGDATILKGPDPLHPIGVDARAINNQGMVVGSMQEDNASPVVAYYWTAADGMMALPPLVPDGYATATDINDGGTIIGVARAGDGLYHAVLWHLSASVTVVIDVRRVINVKGARGVIPVAVYSTRVDDGDDADFDASTIDAASVAFGPGGAAPAHGGHFADLDGDGDIDAMFHFRVGASGVACGDTEAVLTGATTDGQAFTGADAIRVVGC